MSKRKIGGNPIKSRRESLDRLVKTGTKAVVTFVNGDDLVTISRVQLERRDNPGENFGVYIKGTDKQIPLNYVRPTGSFRFINVDLTNSLVQDLRRYRE